MDSIERRVTQRRLWVLALAFVTTYCRGEAPDLKTFTSPDGEYTVHYPSDWVHYPEAKSLYILNFPLDRIVKEVLLPDHGAMITFANTRPQPKSLQEWIERDVKRRGIDRRRDFALEIYSQPSRVTVTETLSHSARGRYEFEEVDWYFSIGERLFDAALLYNNGDSQKDEYVEVLKRVVSSIKLGPIR